MTSRKVLAWVALAVVVVAGVVVLVARSQPSSSPEARAARLEQELACPVCEGQSVGDSNSPQARAIRAEIPELIAQGRTDAQIRAYYVDKYDERILETPSSSGIGVLAWVVPMLALFAGLGAIVVAVRRWTRAPRLAATAEDEALVARARLGRTAPAPGDGEGAP